MPRKNQQIIVVVHRPEDMASIYKKTDVMEFWKEKISKAINKSNVSDCYYNIEKIQKLSD